RGFAIDPSGHWLIACGEQSEHVAVYAIAPDDGTRACSDSVPSSGANWVAIV
ncbi:beta-propeller fold lactonase family protein, partial [Burkholderia cenocepacia]|uniref:beta-propeller fold lactonase family protein n=1 Tax=Burkholderia cenocepacia TaxID=95486 RepID=UPI0024B7225A